MSKHVTDQNKLEEYITVAKAAILSKKTSAWIRMLVKKNEIKSRINDKGVLEVFRSDILTHFSLKDRDIDALQMLEENNQVLHSQLVEKDKQINIMQDTMKQLMELHASSDINIKNSIETKMDHMLMTLQEIRNR